MPRELRFHVPEAFYHVIARGNDRMVIFSEDEDYQFYLSRLDKYAGKFSVQIHAYALMGNQRIDAPPVPRKARPDPK